MGLKDTIRETREKISHLFTVPAKHAKEAEQAIVEVAGQNKAYRDTAVEVAEKCHEFAREASEGAVLMFHPDFNENNNIRVEDGNVIISAIETRMMSDEELSLARNMGNFMNRDGQMDNVGMTVEVKNHAPIDTPPMEIDMSAVKEADNALSLGTRKLQQYNSVLYSNARPLTYEELSSRYLADINNSIDTLSAALKLKEIIKTHEVQTKDNVLREMVLNGNNMSEVGFNMDKNNNQTSFQIFHAPEMKDRFLAVIHDKITNSYDVVTLKENELQNFCLQNGLQPYSEWKQALDYGRFKVPATRIAEFNQVLEAAEFRPSYAAIEQDCRQRLAELGAIDPSRVSPDHEIYSALLNSSKVIERIMNSKDADLIQKSNPDRWYLGMTKVSQIENNLEAKGLVFADADMRETYGKLDSSISINSDEARTQVSVYYQTADNLCIKINYDPESVDKNTMRPDFLAGSISICKNMTIGQIVDAENNGQEVMEKVVSAREGVKDGITQEIADVLKALPEFEQIAQLHETFMERTSQKEAEVMHSTEIAQQMDSIEFEERT